MVSVVLLSAWNSYAVAHVVVNAHFVEILWRRIGNGRRVWAFFLQVAAGQNFHDPLPHLHLGLAFAFSSVAFSRQPLWRRESGRGE